METAAKYFSMLALLAGLAVIVLKPGQQELLKVDTVISSLLRYEANHAADYIRPRVAVGFGACRDLFVTAAHVMANTSFPAHPASYPGVASKEQLVSMFGYFFKAGAAAERFVHDPALWDELVGTGRADPAARWGLGGNAPVMASRFAREGAAVLLGAKLSPGLAEAAAEMQLAGGSVPEDDIHLILEYKRDEVWAGAISPRANRFILHRDENNPLVSSLEQFRAALPVFRPQLLVVGGLQMMDNFPFKEGERLKRILAIQEAMVEQDSGTRIHFEMASFVDSSLLAELVQHVIPQADSLGMNEQELPNLHSMLTAGRVTEVADSNPRIAVVLDQMRDVYRLLGIDTGTNRPLTRIHLHTLAYQAILTARGSAWQRSGAAAVKASLTAHRHVCADQDVRPENSYLIMDESFSTSKEGGRRVPFEDGRPLSCWEEEELGVEICLAPVLVCAQAVQTAGGGDNISAAGLVVQI